MAFSSKDIPGIIHIEEVEYAKRNHRLYSYQFSYNIVCDLSHPKMQGMPELFGITFQISDLAFNEMVNKDQLGDFITETIRNYWINFWLNPAKQEEVKNNPSPVNREEGFVLTGAL